MISVSNILIIGAGGRMGGWFFRYFKYLRSRNDGQLNEDNKKSIYNKNFIHIGKIFLVDSKKIDKIDGYKERDVFVSTKISDFLREANVVVFCTPTDVTIKLLHKLLDTFELGTIIIEVSSIKSQIHKKLESYSNHDKKFLFISIHPMFGPGALVSSTSNIILHVPNKNSPKNRETKLVKKIFPNLEIIKIENAASHDVLVSVMISLIYFMNLIFSKTLLDTINNYDLRSRKINLRLLKRISGSSYKIQSVLSESILTDDASLFVGLFLNSPKSITIIKKYGKLYNNLASKLEKRDSEYVGNFVSNIKKEIGSQIDLDASYRVLYEFLNRT
ncbi:MAG TPA: prephenate dehydrogenase/arogenate dehydrogenase family protein [Candidatus Nitrosocosmicus sp.]|nr:prephenate dehydrogenase/arogenate dehydrogenase family protein [Candidatus Nitrosocosmicus sp.]